jgi:hypothetical protein
MLSQITKGKVKKPLLMCLYGTEGVGKTTFASKLDNVVFAGPESGSDQLDVARFPTPLSWNSFLDQLQSLLGKHEFKSLAVDSLDWCEKLIHTQLIEQYKVKTIEDVAGGYGRYVAVVNGEWTKLIDLLRKLREERKMNIILIAHYMVKAFNDPMTNNPYDRYQMKLLDKSAALFREFVDILGFATFEVVTRGEIGKKGKGIGEGFRVLYTEKRPAHDAKNRFSLPYAMPFSYEELESNLGMASEDKLANIKKEISDILIDFQDVSLLPKINESITKAGNDYALLTAIKNRILVISNGGK